MWMVKVKLMTGEKEVMYEGKILTKRMCVIFDGGFHSDFSSYGSWNVGCYNIIETV
jgi:hypothetical protein